MILYFSRNSCDQDGLRCFLSPWCLPIRKSVNLSLTVKVTWDPAGKLELELKSKGAASLFIHHQSVPLFLPYERLLSFFHCFTFLFFSLGHSFFYALPPYSKHIVSSPCWLTSGCWLSRDPTLWPEKLHSVLHPLPLTLFPVVEHLKSNIYQWRRAHSKDSI